VDRHCSDKECATSRVTCCEWRRLELMDASGRSNERSSTWDRNLPLFRECTEVLKPGAVTGSRLDRLIHFVHIWTMKRREAIGLKRENTKPQSLNSGR